MQQTITISQKEKELIDKEAESYEINVLNEVKSVRVEGIAEDSLSTVEGNNTYNLVSGRNEITIRVQSEDNNIIDCYTIYGEKLYSFYIDSIIDYRTGNSNNLYIFTKNQIYSLNTTDNYQPVCILNTANIRASVFFCDNIFFDYNGQVINPANNTVISTKIEGNQINCAIAEEYYCIYGGIHYDLQHRKRNLPRIGQVGRRGALQLLRQKGRARIYLGRRSRILDRNLSASVPDRRSSA